jgi:hypothetical protein
MRHRVSSAWFLTLAAAFGLLSVCEVGASCGDYLRHALDDSRLPGTSKPLPCHGPQCSQKPSQPVAPITSLPRPSKPDDVADPIHVPWDVESATTYSPFDDEPRPLRSGLKEIFHPPRAISPL